MPFEIAPQKQSAAQQLAALIEAGRACNPDMRHINGAWGDGKERGCAMTFALKAAGIEAVGGHSIPLLAEYMGVEHSELEKLTSSVISANDNSRLSLDEIVTGLRDGTVQKLQTYVYVSGWTPFVAISKAQLMKLYPGLNESVGDKISLKFYGDYLDFDADVLKPKKIAKPQPAKKVRTSAKTGASWPVAKHAYA